MAKAIVSVVRKQARATAGVHQHIAYVWLVGEDSNVVVLREDWEQIMPFIQDGTFTPMQTPAVAQVGYLHPGTHYDDPTIDQRDPYFYGRVLGILRGLFTEEFPTSDL